MRRSLMVASAVVFLMAALSGVGLIVAGWSWYTLVSIGLFLRVVADMVAEMEI